MGRIPRYFCAASIVFAVLMSAAGCAPKSPEEKVSQLRGFYSARLNGFIVEEEPILPEAAEIEALEPEESVAEAVGEKAEVEVIGMAEIPVMQKVRLDILIQHRSSERLPGITLEVSMADSAGQDKGHWRVWFDTANVPKATVTQFTHILEDVGYEEGDGFFVEVRHPVPVEERGEYREFAAAP